MQTWAHAEMNGAQIPNSRRRNNTALILSGLVENPSLSFSAAVGPATRQAFRRLCKVKCGADESAKPLDYSDVLSGHVDQSRSRILAECHGDLVLLVQDTTMFNFAGLKGSTGLGYCNSVGERCLFGHSMLALSSDGLPLGVTHLELWARDEADLGKGDTRHTRDIKDKESHRWITALQTVESRLPDGQAALFIQDREADIFAFLEAPTRDTSYILVRAAQSRKVEIDVPGDDTPQKGLLFNASQEAPIIGKMQVSIPRSPSRDLLSVELQVQCTRLRILPPAGKKDNCGKPVTAWVVRAVETNPPDGEKPIEWILVTTMPVLTPDDAYRTVRYYSKRWLIERLHYAIKSGGCNAERLQVDDVHSIKLALAFYYMTAWRILFITYLARVNPTAPVESVLDAIEIQVLQTIGKKPIKTCAEAVIAIAKLGGHEPYKNGPPPGIKRLWLGLRRLEDMAAGWLLAKAQLGRPS
jgi:hypothetical protein